MPDTATPETSARGLITRAQSGFFDVVTPHGETITCRLRGRLKQTRVDTDIAAIGDHVAFTRQGDGTGMIEVVEPRTRALVRRAPAPRKRRYAARGLAHLERDRETVIIANPDQAIFVFACAEPAPHLRMLDRFLVVAEANHVPAIICANKLDLVEQAAAEALFGHYAAIGYPVIYTSATTGQGVERLRAQLTGKVSVLAGPSGVGKSSLLNRVQQGLAVAVSEVSAATGKGRHTTRHPELHPIDGGGWLADTPGIRAMALYDMEPEEIDGYFVEIAPLVAQCEFRSCTHTQEPGCAVLAALKAGDIHPSRYDSYRRLREGVYD